MNEETEALYTESVELLSSHDWYYEMSEDPGVFKRGAYSMMAIIKNLRRMPLHIAIELWDSHAPSNKFGARLTWMEDTTPSEEVEE